MLTYLLLEMVKKFNLLSTTVVKLIEEELRPLIRELAYYLAEKRAANHHVKVEVPITEPCETKEQLFNRNEAADYLKVDPRTVTRYRVNRRLRFVYNDDNRIRYRKKDLNDCYYWKWGRRPSA